MSKPYKSIGQLKPPKDLGGGGGEFTSKMWNLWTKNMNGVTDKVEILHRRQTDPAL